MKLKEAHVFLLWEDADGEEREAEFHLPTDDFRGTISGTIKQARDLRPVYGEAGVEPAGFEEHGSAYTFKFTLKRTIPKRIEK